ncbi:MAG: hypothetical protein AAFX76_13245 [Planctomycetota bacterium]
MPNETPANRSSLPTHMNQTQASKPIQPTIPTATKEHQSGLARSPGPTVYTSRINGKKGSTTVGPST